MSPKDSFKNSYKPTISLQTIYMKMNIIIYKPTISLQTIYMKMYRNEKTQALQKMILFLNYLPTLSVSGYCRPSSGRMSY